MQLVLATLTTVFFLVAQLLAMPYRAAADNFLALGCNTCLSLLFLGSILFQYSSLIDSPNLQLIMGDEQEDIYSMDERAVTILLFLCAVGTLIVCAFILTIQVYVDIKRRQRDERAAKARRLRHKVDGSEVLLPLPVPMAPRPTDFEPTYKMGAVSGLFHIFLSHVWSTGQDQMRIVKQRLLEMIPDVIVFLDVRLPGLESLMLRLSSCCSLAANC